MPEQKAGSRLVGIILAAVVLLVLLGLLIYLVWRESNPKPKQGPQRASASLMIRSGNTAKLTHMPEAA